MKGCFDVTLTLSPSRKKYTMQEPYKLDLFGTRREEWKKLALHSAAFKQQRPNKSQ
jgi:hypothetical protein